MLVYLIEKRRLTGVAGLTELGPVEGVYALCSLADAECKRLNERCPPDGLAFYIVAVWNVVGEVLPKQSWKKQDDYR